MKFSTLLILTLLLLSRCNSNHTKATNPNELIYRSDAISSPTLSTQLDLSGNMIDGELTANLKLTNSGDKNIDIQEVAVATTDGIRSIPETGNIGFFLKPGTDSTISLKFSPINNLQLFRVTGLRGSFKSVYKVLVTYKVPGNNEPQTIALKTETEKNAYLNYSRKYKKSITGYSFDTKSGFNEIQKKYLETLKQVNHPPFVYLSEQEIAVSGLNFRLNSYYLEDTLHAEFSIVNHADFPVKFIADAFDITANRKNNPGEVKTLIIEKIAGAQQDQTMMEKGDRLVIHFKKYFKLSTPPADILTFDLKKAFWLNGKKPLFVENIRMLPATY